MAKAAARLPKRAWQRMSTGASQKGVRDYDWAMIEVTADDTPDGHDGGTGTFVLLVRRHRYTRTVSYYRSFAPGPVTLARLVSLISLRWRVEDDFQDAKEICHLDKGQVTCWNSWHRWSVIALVAYAFLPSPPPSNVPPRPAVTIPSRPIWSPSAATNSSACYRALILPPPDETPNTCCHGPPGTAAINTTPASATAAGTRTPTPHHDQKAQQRLSQLPHQKTRRSGWRGGLAGRGKRGLVTSRSLMVEGGGWGGWGVG
ncbi:hypothetical protein ACFRKC_49630, partial [Streptomyces chartreusis]